RYTLPTCPNIGGHLTAHRRRLARIKMLGRRRVARLKERSWPVILLAGAPGDLPCLWSSATTAGPRRQIELFPTRILSSARVRPAALPELLETDGSHESRPAEEAVQKT